MSSIANPGSFLRVQRNFPSEIQPLTVELNKTYVDIANQVNNRTCGLYGVATTIVTGESWYLAGESGRQQTLRAVYLFSSASLTITHNLNLANVVYFTRIYGTFFDGTYWNTLPYVDVTAANNQINVQVSTTQIIITPGGGSPPAISNGIVIVEWLSQV